MDALGVKTIRDLRAKPLNELTGLSAGGLVVDGYLIPEDESMTFMNGKQNAVDVLTGSNKDEANFGICGPGAGVAGRGGQGMTADAFKTAAQRKFGELADQYLQLYPAASDADAQRAAHEACADEINWNMRQWAAAQAKLGKKAYTYFFTRIPTLNGQPSPQGATHTAEISYAFNNPKGQPTQTWNDIDTKLADAMSSYWVNFITKGDPNGGGLPQWPQYKDLATGKVMVLGDTPQAESAPAAAKLSFYQSAFQRMLKTASGNLAGTGSRGAGRPHLVPRFRAPQRRTGRIVSKLPQLDALVVLLENLFERRAFHRHAVGAHLTHPHAVAPAAAVQRHAEDRAASVALDVEREQAVAQTEERAKPQRANRPPAIRAGDFRRDQTLRRPPLDHPHVRQVAQVERAKRRIELLPGPVHLPLARREKRSAAGFAKLIRYTSIRMVSPSARKSINSPPIHEPCRIARRSSPMRW